MFVRISHNEVNGYLAALDKSAELMFVAFVSAHTCHESEKLEQCYSTLKEMADLIREAKGKGYEIQIGENY